MNRYTDRGIFFPGLLLILLLLPPLAVAANTITAGCSAALSGRSATEQQPGGAQAEAAACFPWKVVLWEEAARQALQAGQPELAVRYLESALQNSSRFSPASENPASTALLVLLADAQQQAGDDAGALESWKRIARQTGLSPQTARTLASLHLTQADFPAARQTWEALLAQDSQDAQAHYQLGLLLAAHDPEAALPHLEQAAAHDPQLDEPVSTLRRAILSARIGDSPAYTLLSSGRALASLGDWGLAAEAFRQSILQQPGYAEAWAYLGEARQHLQSAGDPEQTQDASGADGLFELQTALDLDPDSLSARTFISLYWQRRAKFEPALESIQRAIEIDPGNPVLLAQMASIQAEAGDFESAYETYRQAAALSPFDPAYLRQIILFALDYNYQVEGIALPIARQLLVDHPGDPIDLDLMGRVLIYLGDLAGAQKFLNRALQANPHYAPAHLHLGLVYMLRGEPGAASGHLQMAQALDPQGPSASQARRLLESGPP